MQLKPGGARLPVSNLLSKSCWNSIDVWDGQFPIDFIPVHELGPRMDCRSNRRSFFLLCTIFVLPCAMLISGEENRPKPEDIASTLRNKGGFDMVATLIDAIDLSIIPSNSTILAPNDQAAAKLDIYTFAMAKPILQYHVLTRQLPFSDLRRMNVGSRIETLLRNNTVQITRNDPGHFAIDNVRLMNPDLFFNSGFVIHGINGILNYSQFGNPVAAPAPFPTLLKGPPQSAPASPPLLSPRSGRSPSPSPHSSFSPTSPSVISSPQSSPPPFHTQAEPPGLRFPRFPAPGPQPEVRSGSPFSHRRVVSDHLAKAIIIASLVIAAGLMGFAVIFSF